MTLYEILGVPSDCSSEHLRQQYHRLLLEYHPDKRQSNDQSSQNRFEQIQNAYGILSNQELRVKYDQEQERQHLHTLAHTNIDLTDFTDDNEYICRCGTILELDLETNFDVIECPNCSMKIELKNK